jgi:hypothetical protein
MDGMCDSWMGMDGCRFVINNPLHVAVCRIALKECTLNSFVLQSVIYHSTLYISTVGRYGIWASLTQHTAVLRDTATREYGRLACERREREREHVKIDDGIWNLEPEPEVETRNIV